MFLFLGEDNSVAARQAKIHQKMQKANKILESIQAPGLTIASDFFTSDEMTSFKTRKKKVWNFYCLMFVIFATYES